MSDIERRDVQGEDERALAEARARGLQTGLNDGPELPRNTVRMLNALRSRPDEPTVPQEELEGMPWMNVLPYGKGETSPAGTAEDPGSEALPILAEPARAALARHPEEGR